MDSAKRCADSQPFCSNSSSSWLTCSGDSAWGASLRVNSTRECSRAARYFSARPLSERPGRRETGGSGLAIFHFVGTAYRGHQRLQLRHAQGLADLVLDLAGQIGVLAQEFAGVVLALADFLATIGVPGAGLVDDLGRHPQVDDLAFAA